MSRWVGSAAIEALVPSEDVWLRLLLPGVVITWLIAGYRRQSDRVGWAQLASLLVSRCLETADVATAHCQVLRGWLLGRGVDAQARCLSRVEQALVVSHERRQ